MIDFSLYREILSGEQMSHIILKQLYQKIIHSSAQNDGTICVFDLDSTLFNVSPRSQKILHDFAHLHGLPDLLSVQVQYTDWGIYESLVRFGYQKSEYPALHLNLKEFWMKHFFSNEYLHYDTPYLGAVYFVQSLNNSNCSIHYLTGRDVNRMHQGTVEVLNKWLFPFESQHLHMKPHRSENDEEYKYQKLKQIIDLNPGKDIYFFENEPVNINYIGKMLPEVHIVFMDTTHARLDTVKVKHTQIDSFFLGEV